MESPQYPFNQYFGPLPLLLQEEDTLVDPNSPNKLLQDSPQPSSEYSSTSRRVTRSQTTGRPTIRWGKHGRGDPSDTSYRRSSASLKRSFDARAVDDETDVEADQDSTYVPSKLLKLEPTMLIPESSSATLVEDTDIPQPKEVTPGFESSGTPMPGEYTFLDASSSSFASERRGPRIRTAPPIPVPNLTKKSRGRRVPTAGDDATEGEVIEGRKGRVYVCKVEDCGKCFSRGEHLKRHIRSIHTHEKPFDCPHPSCDKRFNRNDNLLQHLRVHKGDDSSQTSADSAHAAITAESAPDDSSLTTTATHRASSKSGGTTRRAVRPTRKSKSAASTPPIHPARLAASRAASRNAPLTLPRTYSLPPLPSLAPPYHNPTAAVFMNNTNIAVSSLRTSMDEETDHDQETELSEDEGHHRQTTHSLSDLRSMYSFRDAFSSAPLVPRKGALRGNSLPIEEPLDSAPPSTEPEMSSSPSPVIMSRESSDEAHKSAPHSPATTRTR